MITEPAVGVALIGCGFMGLRHLRGYAALARAGLTQQRVVAVLDVDPMAAERAAAQAAELLGERPTPYVSLDELLADPRVGAVDVVTDPRSHPEIAITALRARRHVLCEKPLALTVAEGRRMVRAAEETGLVLATGENYRRGGANRLAKAVITSGLLGTIHLFREFRVGGNDQVIISRWRHLRASGSIGLDMSIHYADIVDYLLGPVDRVWGRGIIAEPLRYPADGGAPIRPDGEDAVFASMITRGDIDVQFAYLPSGPGHWGERTVHGTAGSMIIPPDRTDGDVQVILAGRTLTGAEVAVELGEAFSLSPATVAVLGPDGTGGKGAPWERVDAGYLAVEIADFVEAVQTGGRAEVDGVDGLRALAVVHAIFESGLARREVSVDEVLSGTLHDYQDTIFPATASRAAEAVPSARAGEVRA